jgi:hypothetical protein
MNRVFILSAVPLATALSYAPSRAEMKIEPDNEIQREEFRQEPNAAMQSKPVPLATGRNVQGPLSTVLSTDRSTDLSNELQHRGIEAGAAGRIIEQASLAGGLDPRGYQWQKGQRLTGVLLVPDSAAVVCGFANQPIWFFRTQMLAPKENLDCSARIHLNSNRSSRWTSMLSRPGAL